MFLSTVGPVSVTTDLEGDSSSLDRSKQNASGWYSEDTEHADWTMTAAAFVRCDVDSFLSFLIGEAEADAQTNAAGMAIRLQCIDDDHVIIVDIMIEFNGTTSIVRTINQQAAVD